MSGKSARSNNRGDLFSNFVSGKDRQFRTSESAFRGRDSVNATGGNHIYTPGNGYKYHIFTSPGNFVVSDNPGAACGYVIVAGGGAGGSNSGSNLGGGGGGAGGYLEGSIILPSGTYPIDIGSGGPSAGTQGQNTTALGKTSWGGGKGNASSNGSPGGSGGGGAFNSAGGVGLGTYTPSAIIASDFPGESYPYAFTQGYPGGPGSTGPGGYVPGAGGGGAGAAGKESYPSPLAPGEGSGGGDGRAAFNGDTGIPPSFGTAGPSAGRWFAGGGGGGCPTNAPSTKGLGGAGGGGNGSRSSAAVAGGTNTGGGGGAGAYSGGGTSGAAGGPGIVIIRYSLTP